MNALKRPPFAMAAFLVLLNFSAVFAAPLPKPERRTVAAPPLLACKTIATSDLGLWDDIFVAHDQDVIVLRRGDQLFSLAMEASTKPKTIAKVPAASDTEIVAGAAVGKSFWLFLNSSKAAPCAVDAYGGTVVAFEIPGLKVPGSHAPGIQSCYIVPQEQAAILMVSGGDNATWPRDGNRPVYFWMDLKSGKSIRFPIGWELNYFSADERVAVFNPKNAIEMRTGQPIDGAPDRRKERHVPFDWTDRQRVRPLYDRRPGKGDADYFAGLSVEGIVAPVALGIEEVRYLSMAKADDSYCGFRLRPSGASSTELSPLWIVPFKKAEKTESIAADVLDFTMLGQGNAVYAVVEKEAKPALSKRRDCHEAFFYARAERFSWNVLEGVERLPKLDEALAKLDFVRDSMKVRFIEGFGTSRHVPAAICLFEHLRGDYRARLPGMAEVLESVTWRRALLIDGNGKRFLTTLFREDSLPDQIWLHKSGKLLSGTDVWEENKAGRKRQVQLAESTVQKP